MSKLGIVCEGGGARGAYTGGVLVWMREHNIPIDYINGISAGAYTAVNYLSGQDERMKNICTKYIASSRYAGIGAVIHEHSPAGLNYAFEEIEKMEPLDVEAMMASPVTFEFGVLNCESGIIEYYGQNEVKNDYELFKCSCRLPGLTKIGHVNGNYYLDGGVKTMIPINRAEEIGVDYNFVVLTKTKEYVRKPEKKWQLFFIKLLVGNKFPKVMDFLHRRHLEFAEEVEYIYKREAEGHAFVLRPSVDLGVGRLSKDSAALEKMWELGFKDCEDHKEEILALVKRAKGEVNE